jgi:hypothetical protein
LWECYGRTKTTPFVDTVRKRVRLLERAFGLVACLVNLTCRVRRSVIDGQRVAVCPSLDMTLLFDSAGEVVHEGMNLTGRYPFVRLHMQ